MKCRENGGVRVKECHASDTITFPNEWLASGFSGLVVKPTSNFLPNHLGNFYYHMVRRSAVCVYKIMGLYRSGTCPLKFI